MSVLKSKAIVSELLAHDTKVSCGTIVLEKLLINNRKVLKNLKKLETPATQQQAQVNETEKAALKATVDNNVMEKLKLVLNVTDLTPVVVEARAKFFREMVDTFKSKALANYEKYSSSSIKSNIVKPLSIDEYVSKAVGVHEKSATDRKLVNSLLQLYNTLQATPNKKGELLSTIVDKETEYKLMVMRSSLKVVKRSTLGLISDRLLSICAMYIADITSIIGNLPVDDSDNSPKSYNLSALFKNKDFKSSKTNLYKNMVRLSDYFKLVVDKSKDEKNCEVHLLDLPDNKDVKSYVECSPLITFVMENTNTTCLKEFKQLPVDCKTKNLLNYLSVAHLYEEILPLLKMTKDVKVSYTKKVTTTDDKGVTTTKEEERTRLVNPVLNKLNSDTICNVWS